MFQDGSSSSSESESGWSDYYSSSGGEEFVDYNSSDDDDEAIAEEEEQRRMELEHWNRVINGTCNNNVRSNRKYVRRAKKRASQDLLPSSPAPTLLNALAREGRKLEEQRKRLGLKDTSHMNTQIQSLSKERKKLEKDERRHHQNDDDDNKDCTRKDHKKEERSVHAKNTKDRIKHSNNNKQTANEVARGEEVRRTSKERDKVARINNNNHNAVGSSGSVCPAGSLKESDNKRSPKKAQQKVVEAKVEAKQQKKMENQTKPEMSKMSDEDAADAARQKAREERAARQKARLERIRQRREAESAEEQKKKEKEFEKEKAKKEKEKAAYNSEKGRCERAYGWFTKLAFPNREEMKKKISRMPHIDITEEDVDLLPWNRTGTMVNAAKITRMYT